MKKKSQIAFFVIVFVCITVAWLCSLVEITTLVSYRSCFTAGELFAWETANKYEVSDIIGYCVRYVWLYWLACTVIYIGLCRMVFRMACRLTKRKAWAGTVVAMGLLIPFVLPNSPVNLFGEYYLVYRQIVDIRKHQFDNRGFAFHAVRHEEVPQQEVYVLAIGESLRYKNLSLNGEYERETTPMLQQQSNLCLYSDYYANATLTQHAMPMLLTDAITENFDMHFGKKTIAAAFAEVGFKTALVSHRAQLMNNGYHNYLALDFDTLLFVEHDSLIAPTIGQLTERNAKWFVVTNYLGNHMFYTNRTEDCLVWRPDYNADPKAKSDSLFLNAYDNSVLYTDRLMNEYIEVLKQTNAVSAWLFVSDHGEYIDNRVSGHGHTYHPTKDEYHVPLLVWYSDEYKAAYPEKVENVIKHKDEPVCADHVFWSILDMAGIRIDSTLQQEGMSIFGDTLLPHPRTLLLPDGKSVMTLD